LLQHACPFTIRASTKPRVHRVPNVVGLGFAKCGTGTLAFLGKLDKLKRNVDLHVDYNAIYH